MLAWIAASRRVVGVITLAGLRVLQEESEPKKRKREKQRKLGKKEKATKRFLFNFEGVS